MKPDNDVQQLIVIITQGVYCTLRLSFVRSLCKLFASEPSVKPFLRTLEKLKLRSRWREFK